MIEKRLLACVVLVAVLLVPSSLALAATPEPEEAAPPGGVLMFPVFDDDATQMKYNIVAMDLETGDRDVLVKNASQPAVSHDGKAIAYKNWTEDLNEYGLHSAMLADPAGTDWRFSDSMAAQRPMWAPEDAFYYYFSRQESDRLDRVMITEGTQGRTILRPDMDNKEILGQSPAILVKGDNYVVIYQGCEFADCGLWQRDIQGTNPIRLTEDPTDQALSVSPDGTRIAFMSYSRDGADDWEVYVMGADGGNVTRLTDRPGIDGLPTWSPDGEWIAFVREPDPESNVWTIMAVQPDGTGEQKLADLGALHGQVMGTTSDQCQGWANEQISWGP